LASKETRMFVGEHQRARSTDRPSLASSAGQAPTTTSRSCRRPTRPINARWIQARVVIDTILPLRLSSHQPRSDQTSSSHSLTSSPSRPRTARPPNPAPRPPHTTLRHTPPIHQNGAIASRRRQPPSFQSQPAPRRLLDNSQSRRRTSLSCFLSRQQGSTRRRVAGVCCRRG
jgi:hypothetical protein